MDETFDFWYYEELTSPTIAVDESVKSLPQDADLTKEQAAAQARATAQGIVRVDQPRWTAIDPVEHKLLTSGADAHYFFVRLGFQFDLTEAGRSGKAQFTFARCEARLWPVSGTVYPRVYEVIPRDFYEGEARQIQVELGPEIKVGDTSASLGKVSTSFAVGRLEPVVVGFPGEDERAPYWELRPKSKSLLGTRHLWMVLEVPNGCPGVRLSTRAMGDIQTYFGPVPVGPKQREWETRPSIVIT
ncbi:MAG TPA: hypothetical protein VHO69_17500 [Phototrophicaceae bacterium]|nr:hypothetical protein [Phototrophicaceae bacterium]